MSDFNYLCTKIELKTTTTTTLKNPKKQKKQKTKQKNKKPNSHFGKHQKNNFELLTQLVHFNVLSHIHHNHYVDITFKILTFVQPFTFN